jgi:hypothetical protein
VDRIKGKPEPVGQPDLTELKKEADRFISSIIDGTSSEENYERITQYRVFSSAMKALYGDDIFVWIRDNE